MLKISGFIDYDMDSEGTLVNREFMKHQISKLLYSFLIWSKACYSLNSSMKRDSRRNRPWG